MIHQTEFRLSAKRRGFHLITNEILDHLPKPLPEMGLLNLFVKHNSCALSINENADPDVLRSCNGGCRRSASTCKMFAIWSKPQHPNN